MTKTASPPELEVPGWKGSELPVTCLRLYTEIRSRLAPDAPEVTYRSIPGRTWEGSVNAVINEIWPAMKRPEGMRGDPPHIARVRRAINTHLRYAMVMVCLQPGGGTSNGSVQAGSPRNPSLWWVRSAWTPRNIPGDHPEMQRLAALSNGHAPAAPAVTFLPPVPEIPGTITTTYEDIGPVQAASFMEMNACGRGFSEQQIAAFARDMEQGRWYLTHQGIAFDPDGWLIDGQTRMRAILASGCTVRLAVTRGLSREAFEAIDSGRIRSIGDKLRIERGTANSAKDLGAIARRAVLWDAGRPWSRNMRPTQPEIMAVIREHPDLLAAGDFADTWKGKKVLAPSLAGFCWWLLSSIDPAEAHTFFYDLASGRHDDDRDPVWVLRERLARTRTVARGLAAVRTEIPVALVVLGWNARRKGKLVKKLQLPDNMTDATFPRPI